MGKTLKLIQDLVARSMVSKAPQKAEKVLSKLAKRVRHEGSSCHALIMVSRELRVHVGPGSVQEKATTRLNNSIQAWGEGRKTRKEREGKKLRMDKEPGERVGKGRSR